MSALRKIWIQYSVWFDRQTSEIYFSKDQCWNGQRKFGWSFLLEGEPLDELSSRLDLYLACDSKNTKIISLSKRRLQIL